MSHLQRWDKQGVCIAAQCKLLRCYQGSCWSRSMAWICTWPGTSIKVTQRYTALKPPCSSACHGFKCHWNNLGADYGCDSNNMRPCWRDWKIRLLFICETLLVCFPGLSLFCTSSNLFPSQLTQRGYKQQNFVFSGKNAEPTFAAHSKLL